MLCGLVCAGMPAPEQHWLQELLAGADPGDPLYREAALTLHSLAELTREQLEGPHAGIRPLLPNEAAPLRERALELYDWTRGFLFGVGLAGLDATELSEQASEVLDDFAAITRLDLDALEEGEENEQSLAELVEFVWVAAMLVFEECGRREDGP